MIPPRLLLALILILSLSGASSAASSASNIYFAQSAQGANNGADCADAYAYNDGNHGINSSADWVAGNTLHICGTISLPAQTNFITAQNSGSSTSPITIQFESGAIFQEPYFGTGGSSGINLSGNNYITITSVATGRAAAGTLANYGTIQAYANGTSGTNACPGVNNTGTAACTYQVNPTTAIQMMGSNNITVSNLSISNMYLQTASDSMGGAPGIDGIQFQGSNVTIYNNIMWNDGLAIDNTTYGNDTNTNIYGNNFSEDGWALGCAGANVTNTNYQFHDNNVHDFDRWTLGGGATHVNGIHCYDLSISGGATSGGIQTFYLYNNFFGGNMGTCCWTSWVYLEADQGGCGSGYWTNSTGTVYAWNNIFAGNLDLPNPRLDICAGSGHVVYNNTFVVGTPNNGNCLGIDGDGSATATVENNGFTGCNTPLYLVGVSSLTANYNAYAGISGGNSIWQWSGHYNGNSFSAWQAACNCDSSSQSNLSGSLGVNSSGVPQSGSMLLMYGANLMGSAKNNMATLASSTTDGGTITSPEARPGGTCSSMGALPCWDVGAYEVSASGSLPSPPTGLTAVVN